MSKTMNRKEFYEAFNSIIEKKKADFPFCDITTIILQFNIMVVLDKNDIPKITMNWHEAGRLMK